MEYAVQTMRGFADSLALARWAEDEGLAAFAVADHYLFGESDGPAYDQLTLLGGIARETDRIRLVSLVSPITFRHPAVMLKVAVTLDELSGGRFGLGVGTGWMELEHERFGLDFPGWEERFDRLEEALGYLHAALSPEPAGFDGSHYRLEAFGPRPLPAGLEIVVGGSGPRRTPELAGRYADEFNVFPSATGTIEEKVRTAREAAASAGRDPADLRISTAFPPLVGRSEAEYRERLEAEASSRGLTAGELESRYAGPGIPHGHGDELAAGVARLAGDGVTRIYLQVARMPLAEAQAAVEAFRVVGSG